MFQLSVLNTVIETVATEIRGSVDIFLQPVGFPSLDCKLFLLFLLDFIIVKGGQPDNFSRGWGGG